MTRKPTEVSQVAAATLATFKRNVAERAAAIGVSPGVIARAYGRHTAWISDILMEGRYEARLSLVTVADIATALGVTVPYLLSDDAKARAKMLAAPMPKYLETYLAQPKRYTSKSRPDDAGPDEMTVVEVMKYLGISKQALCMRRKNRRGPKWRRTPTGRFLYNRASVEGFKVAREP